MIRPRLLDLYCGGGGAGMGYHLAGFDVTGVDHVAQPRYPFEFYRADALDYLRLYGSEYDAIHASPPCQAFSLAQRIQARGHLDLIVRTRRALIRSGKPWVIENVEGAPLAHPVTLCGAMFPRLRVYRHRLFEANFTIREPEHPEHYAPVTKMGRAPQRGEFLHVVGNFIGVAQARAAMGVGWMSRDELSEAIPPAYTQYVGTQLALWLNPAEAA